MIVPDHRRPVRIAQNDLSAHVDQLIHEKQATLEHLLVNQHRPFGLRRNDQKDRQQVGRQPGPGSVGYVHDRAVDETLYFVVVVARNVDVVAPLLELYAHTGELGRYDAQILERHVADRDFAPGHRGHADEAAHFDHVRKQRMRRSVQSLHAVDDEQVRRDARDQRAHAVQHPAELLDIRFAGGVVDRRAPLGQYGGHHDIGRAGHRRLVEQHVAAFQAAALDGKEIGSRIEVELGAQLLKTEEMGVEPTPADLIASGLGNIAHAEAGQQRADNHYRAA